jgi:signal transduction histidine kinase
MPPDDRQEAMEEFFSAIENPGREPTIEFRFEDPDGGWTIVGARGKNLFDDEFINGFVVNARDIGELKERERELKQQNEQLQNVQKMVSHDLQNPVSVASESLFLYRDTEDDKWLKKADTAVQRMDEIIEKVASFPIDETNITDTESVDLRETVSSVWDTIRTKDAQLYIQDSKKFEADHSRVKQIFENLIQNAIEHGTGNVIVRVGTTDEGIYVEDTGPGIAEDERSDVFESGYTTDPTNTGFGLSIVKEIVIGHGWEISLTEGEDGGARFEIENVVFQPEVYN